MWEALGSPVGGSGRPWRDMGSFGGGPVGGFCGNPFGKPVRELLGCIWGASVFQSSSTEASIEAIVVSSETVAGAHAINTKRKEAGLAPIATLVMRRSESATLSSTFIREREARGADTTAPATRGRGLMRVWAAVTALFTRESRERAL